MEPASSHDTSLYVGDVLASVARRSHQIFFRSQHMVLPTQTSSHLSSVESSGELNHLPQSFFLELFCRTELSTSTSTLLCFLWWPLVAFRSVRSGLQSTLRRSVLMVLQLSTSPSRPSGVFGSGDQVDGVNPVLSFGMVRYSPRT